MKWLFVDDGNQVSLSDCTQNDDQQNPISSTVIDDISYSTTVWRYVQECSQASAQNRDSIAQRALKVARTDVQKAMEIMEKEMPYEFLLNAAK